MRSCRGRLLPARTRIARCRPARGGCRTSGAPGCAHLRRNHRGRRSLGGAPRRRRSGREAPGGRPGSGRRHGGERAPGALWRAGARHPRELRGFRREPEAGRSDRPPARRPRPVFPPARHGRARVQFPPGGADRHALRSGQRPERGRAPRHPVRGRSGPHPAPLRRGPLASPRGPGATRGPGGGQSRDHDPGRPRSSSEFSERRARGAFTPRPSSSRRCASTRTTSSPTWSGS